MDIAQLSPQEYRRLSALPFSGHLSGQRKAQSRTPALTNVPGVRTTDHKDPLSGHKGTEPAAALCFSYQHAQEEHIQICYKFDT